MYSLESLNSAVLLARPTPNEKALHENENMLIQLASGPYRTLLQVAVSVV